MAKIGLEFVKVKLSVASLVTELLGKDDDIVTGMVNNYLEEVTPDANKIYSIMTGFTSAGRAQGFVVKLWDLLSRTQKNFSGTPLKLGVPKKSKKKHVEVEERVGSLKNKAGVCCTDAQVGTPHLKHKCTASEPDKSSSTKSNNTGSEKDKRELDNEKNATSQQLTTEVECSPSLTPETTAMKKVSGNSEITHIKSDNTTSETKSSQKDKEGCPQERGAESNPHCAQEQTGSTVHTVELDVDCLSPQVHAESKSSDNTKTPCPKLDNVPSEVKTRPRRRPSRFHDKSPDDKSLSTSSPSHLRSQSPRRELHISQERSSHFQSSLLSQTPRKPSLVRSSSGRQERTDNTGKDKQENKQRVGEKETDLKEDCTSSKVRTKRSRSRGSSNSKQTDHAKTGRSLSDERTKSGRKLSGFQEKSPSHSRRSNSSDSRSQTPRRYSRFSRHRSPHLQSSSPKRKSSESPSHKKRRTASPRRSPHYKRKPHHSSRSHSRSDGSCHRSRSSRRHSQYSRHRSFHSRSLSSSSHHSPSRRSPVRSRKHRRSRSDDKSRSSSLDRKPTKKFRNASGAAGTWKRHRILQKNSYYKQTNWKSWRPFMGGRKPQYCQKPVNRRYMFTPHQYHHPMSRHGWQTQHWQSKCRYSHYKPLDNRPYHHQKQCHFRPFHQQHPPYPWRQLPQYHKCGPQCYHSRYPKHYSVRTMPRLQHRRKASSAHSPPYNSAAPSHFDEFSYSSDSPPFLGMYSASPVYSSEESSFDSCTEDGWLDSPSDVGYFRSGRDKNYCKSDRDKSCPMPSRDKNHCKSDRDKSCPMSTRAKNHCKSDRDKSCPMSNRDKNYCKSDRDKSCPMSSRGRNFSKTGRGKTNPMSCSDRNFCKSGRDERRPMTSSDKNYCKSGTAQTYPMHSRDKNCCKSPMRRNYPTSPEKLSPVKCPKKTKECESPMTDCSFDSFAENCNGSSNENDYLASPDKCLILSGEEAGFSGSTDEEGYVKSHDEEYCSRSPCPESPVRPKSSAERLQNLKVVVERIPVDTGKDSSYDMSSASQSSDSDIPSQSQKPERKQHSSLHYHKRNSSADSLTSQSSVISQSSSESSSSIERHKNVNASCGFSSAPKQTMKVGRQRQSSTSSEDAEREVVLSKNKTQKRKRSISSSSHDSQRQATRPYTSSKKPKTLIQPSDSPEPDNKETANRTKEQSNKTEKHALSSAACDSHSCPPSTVKTQSGSSQSSNVPNIKDSASADETTLEVGTPSETVAAKVIQISENNSSSEGPQDQKRELHLSSNSDEDIKKIPESNESSDPPQAESTIDSDSANTTEKMQCTTFDNSSLNTPHIESKKCSENNEEKEQAFASNTCLDVSQVKSEQDAHFLNSSEECDTDAVGKREECQSPCVSPKMITPGDGKGRDGDSGPCSPQGRSPDRIDVKQEEEVEMKSGGSKPTPECDISIDHRDLDQHDSSIKDVEPKESKITEVYSYGSDKERREAFERDLRQKVIRAWQAKLVETITD